MMEFDVEAFHREAVETDSTAEVGPMRDLLVATLDRAGADPTVDDLGNVVATTGATDPDAAAASGGTHLLLNTHIDTVPPHLPYERREDPPGDEEIDGTGGGLTGDIICGRGACDAKGPLAALLDAFLTVDPHQGALTLAVSIDEETTHRPGAHTSPRLSMLTVISSANPLGWMSVRPRKVSSRALSPSTARAPTPPTPTAGTTRFGPPRPSCKRWGATTIARREAPRNRETRRVPTSTGRWAGQSSPPRWSRAARRPIRCPPSV